MPITTVRVPSGAFDAAGKEQAVQAVTEAIARAESIPDDPARRTGIIVLWDELPAGALFSNAIALDALAVPVFVTVEPPAGVLDDARVDRLAAELDAAFRSAYRGTLAVFTSVIVREVPDGRWGRDGRAWHLVDFARTAGYGHLQHLVSGAPAA